MLGVAGFVAASHSLTAQEVAQNNVKDPEDVKNKIEMTHDVAMEPSKDTNHRTLADIDLDQRATTEAIKVAKTPEEDKNVGPEKY